MLGSLRRGVLSGALAGLLSGAFGFLVAEPLMDRAVSLEAARQAAAGEHTVETFDRNTQHLGLLVASLLTGMALGVLFSVVHRLVASSQPPADPWARALRLAGAGLFVQLVAFARYPANPPGVGDSATIDVRTRNWEIALVIGLVGAVLAALVARGLKERGTSPPYRQLAVAGVLAATLGLAFVLPANTDEVTAPVDLIWQFRLLSFAGLVLLWGGLGVAFGLLSERATEPRELIAA